MSPYAKQHTSAGALAFGNYYFRALDWSTATTDPYLVAQISAPTCQACKRVVHSLDSLREVGGHVSGGRIAVDRESVVTGSFNVASDFVVEVWTTEAEIVLIRPGAAPTTTAPSTTNDPSLLFVSWVGSRWQVVEVGSPS
jgi:hypothetical protein